MLPAVRNCWCVKITLRKIASPCCHIICPYPASLGRPATVTLNDQHQPQVQDRLQQSGSTSGAGTKRLVSLLWKPKPCLQGLITRLGLVCAVDQTASHTYPHTEHTVQCSRMLISKGALTWSQALPAIACESFC